MDSWLIFWMNEVKLSFLLKNLWITDRGTSIFYRAASPSFSSSPFISESSSSEEREPLFELEDEDSLLPESLSFLTVDGFYYSFYY